MHLLQSGLNESSVLKSKKTRIEIEVIMFAPEGSKLVKIQENKD